MEIPIFKPYEIKAFFTTKILKEEIPNLFPYTFFPKQFHSDKIIHLVTPLPAFSEEGDAVITSLKSYAIAIQTADCLPILIGDKKKRVVSCVHAGWRGTLNKLLYKTLKNLLNLGAKPDGLLIAIGPHIQGTCYEVGFEVIGKLDSLWKNPPFLIKNKSKYYLDLAQINLYQALELGIPKENIWISVKCTHCLADKYHSYRREKNLHYTQVALISL
ncbi:MAG: peptidoglycan editing factor PgeF [Caldimicrobium sp.]